MAFDLKAKAKSKYNPGGQVTRSKLALLTNFHELTTFRLRNYALFTLWAFTLMILLNIPAHSTSTPKKAWAFPNGQPSCVDSINKEKTFNQVPKEGGSGATAGGKGANATINLNTTSTVAGGKGATAGPTPAPYGMKWNGSVCQLVVVIQQGVADLRFLVGFILSGFLVSSIKLWLTKRNAYRGIKGTTTNLLITVSTLAPEKDRALLCRWAVLAFELSVLKSRSLLDTMEGEQYLTRSNLLTGDEWDSMLKGDRHIIVWYWIQGKAKQLYNNGEIDSETLATICNAVIACRNTGSDLMSAIDRDQPPPYVFVCGVLVNLYLWLQSTAEGLSWATWMNEAPGMMIFAEPRFWCDLIVEYMTTAIFAMLFDVCALLYNPFGPRAFDIDHNKNSTGVRELGMALATGVTIPSSFNSASKMDFTDTDGGKAFIVMNETIKRKRDHFTNGHRLLFSNFRNRRDSVRGSTIGTRSAEVPFGMAKVVEDSSGSRSESEDSSVRRRRIRREKKAAKEGRRRKSHDSNQDDFYDQPPTRDHLHNRNSGGNGERKKKNGRRKDPSEFAMSV